HQRNQSQAAARLAQRGPPRHSPHLPWPQPAEDLAIAIVAEEAQSQHEIDHEQIRQARAEPALTALAYESTFYFAAGNDTVKCIESLGAQQRDGFRASSKH